MTVNEVVKVIHTGFVYFGYLDQICDEIRRTFTADEIDELQKVPFYPTQMEESRSLVLEKYTLFKEAIRVGMFKFFEVGVAAYWRQRWIAEPLKGNLEKVRVVEVNLVRVNGVFYILGAGMNLSLVVFCSEVVIFKIKNMKQ